MFVRDARGGINLPTDCPISPMNRVINVALMSVAWKRHRLLSDDGHLVPNPEYFRNETELKEIRNAAARLTFARANPQESPTFTQKIEGPNTPANGL